MSASLTDSSRLAAGPPTGMAAGATGSPWTGPVVVLVALGVLGQSWLGAVARTSGSLSAPLWYLTLCLIFVPSAALIMSPRLGDRGRVWLTLYMALALLATRFVLYPNQFAYHDELINYRVLLTILSTHHLFHPNSLLPDTADYPGLQVATAGLHQLTGLSPHLSGMVVLFAVRVVMTLAIVRIIERITGSVPAGCLAAAIYATNPQYVFFNSQFSYQSVALPLAFFGVYVVSVRREPGRLLSIVPGAAVVLAVAASHHLTSLALVLVLWVWYLATRVTRRPVPRLLPLAVVSVLIVAAWTWMARAVIVPYIGEITKNNVLTIIHLATGGGGHAFFSDAAGDKNPLWEEVVSLLSVLLIACTLVPSLLLAVVRYRRLTAAALVLFAIAAIYPAVPAGHLASVTAEISDRAAGFVFVGLGFIVAAWWLRDEPFHRHARTSRFTVARRPWVIIAGLTVCFVGGTVLSGPDWIYGPGRYLVSADNRSVDQLALQAANWEGRYLTPDQRTYSDRVNGSLASVYGNENVLTPLANHIQEGSVSNLLLSPDRVPDQALACSIRLRYLIADQRLATSLPHLGIYVDNGEFQYGQRTSPPTPSTLTKFDDARDAQRLFDNGAIRVYDLKDMPCVPSK
jgi:hypothetical protein